MNTQAVDPQKLDRYECSVCGYIYEPAKGDAKRQVAAGIAFDELPADWRCPICRTAKSRFNNIGPVGTPSGFKENLGYGLGVNTLTSGQKNILIFGSLVLVVLLFLGCYGIQ